MAEAESGRRLVDRPTTNSCRGFHRCPRLRTYRGFSIELASSSMHRYSETRETSGKPADTLALVWLW
jgi:hypothetical protein